MPLELLNLLGVGLLASGQLGHQGFLLLQLATKLTCGELRKLFLRSDSLLYLFYVIVSIYTFWNIFLHVGF